MGAIEQIIDIIEDIAQGRYSDEIMRFTTMDNDPTIRRIAEAIGMTMVKIEAREQRLENLIDELKQVNSQLKRNTLNTVRSMAMALGARDEYTKGHDLRAGAYAFRLANRLGLSDDKATEVAVAGILHDIGKIGFCDALFANDDNKPTEAMMAEIRRHPALGGEILRDLDFLGDVQAYIRSHHERMDGAGYPDGLAKEAIPLGARILAIADCFDAITTDRSYQKGRTMEQAFAILRDMAGPKLDPELVELFLQDITEYGMAKNSDLERLTLLLAKPSLAD